MFKQFGAGISEVFVGAGPDQLDAPLPLKQIGARCSLARDP